MRNSKLLQDIQHLRESMSVSNEEGLKSLMNQFSAMQEELERRRDEVLQLRLDLSNGDLVIFNHFLLFIFFFFFSVEASKLTSSEIS